MNHCSSLPSRAKQLSAGLLQLGLVLPSRGDETTAPMKWMANFWMIRQTSNPAGLDGEPLDKCLHRLHTRVHDPNPFCAATWHPNKHTSHTICQPSAVTFRWQRPTCWRFSDVADVADSGADGGAGTDARAEGRADVTVDCCYVAGQYTEPTHPGNHASWPANSGLRAHRVRDRQVNRSTQSMADVLPIAVTPTGKSVHKIELLLAHPSQKLKLSSAC
eukprot:242310-Pleurochrysis_carterae.AAC.1